MKYFDALYLEDLISQAKGSERLRHNRNIHQNYIEPCQRLFNAIEPNSYIRPHRHLSEFKDELLIAVRGLMALITFDNVGKVLSISRFGSEKFGSSIALGFEIPPNTWHTVLALKSCSVLLEVKAGPFNPNQSKDLASWAPEEGSSESINYLQYLTSISITE